MVDMFDDFRKIMAMKPEDTCSPLELEDMKMMIMETVYEATKFLLPTYIDCEEE